MKPINRYEKRWALTFFRVFSGRRTALRAAITLAPFGIFWSVKENDPTARWRKHEYFHWYHQQKYLFIFWYPIYWMLYLVYGYWNHPWEVLAREAEEKEN